VNSEQNHIDELITRSLAGETTAQEDQELATWIALSTKNQEHFNTLRKVFELGDSYLKQAGQVTRINLDQEWNKFLTQSGAAKDEKVRPLHQETNKSNYWLRIAAAVLVVLVSGFIINYFISDKTTIIQTADATRELSLPDGSKVTLNKFSTLTYSSNFNSSVRSVTLKGEAFFDITRSPQKPFVINTPDATVEVLGTSFNVQAYEARNQFEVVVQTGTVKVTVPEVKQAITLHTGDRGVYSRADKYLTQVANTDVNFLAWKTRRITLVESDLYRVVETINNAYQANIQIATDVPATCVVTVTFDQQSLEAILSVLKTTLNLTYRTENGSIIIIHAGC